MKTFLLTAACLWLAATGVQADADPNFYVYLCFGQSNMEGNAQWETIDNQYVDSRFQMLATTNFDSPKRILGRWYTAKCPIVSPAGKLGMSDYFGRTLVAALPDSVKVGVVAVAMGGSPIEMFDKDKYAQKMADNPNEWWAVLARNYYGGNPYQRLVDMGRKAQETGVIRGILLHQGCSNNGDPKWPSMVKKIYDDLLADLGLQADDVPLFVGETLREDQGGACYGHNTVVARMPQVVPTSHVVHSNGCPGNGQDPWHFSVSGYRTMGKRYAYEALRVMGRPTQKDPDYTLPSNLKKFFPLKELEDSEVHLKAGDRTRLTVWATFADGHREDLTDEVTFTGSDGVVVSSDGWLTANTSGTITATYTDFMGSDFTATLTVQMVEGADFQLDQSFTDLAELGSNDFVIYNEPDGKAFFCPDAQNLGYDVLSNALLKTNAAICFRLQKSGARYLLRAITPDGSPYSVWNTPGYLNSQAESGWCSFILGLNNQQGQDIANGALWEIRYVEGKGFTLRTIGTGKYLQDAAPARYDTPAYFAFYTIKERGSSDALTAVPMPTPRQVACFDLCGRRVERLSTGIYVLGGRKVVVK